jgi:hypothetical protein
MSPTLRIIPTSVYSSYMQGDVPKNSDLTDLINRLRQQQAKLAPRAKPTLPHRPTVREVTVDATDIPHHQLFGQQLDGPDVCNHEGWYWSPDPASGGAVPFSIWCGRSKGHVGPHEARTGISLRRHKKRVLQWDDKSS